MLCIFIYIILFLDRVCVKLRERIEQGLRLVHNAPACTHFCFIVSLLICRSEFSQCFVWMVERQTKEVRGWLETLYQEERECISTNQPRQDLMTGVISQLSTTTVRGCWWAADEFNHRKC